MIKTKIVNSKAGFTLLEILLVVGIIAILAGIVILAINPTKQLGDARNAQRRSDVLTILNAVYQYAIDNNGNLPNSAGITSTVSPCGTSSSVATDASTTLAATLVGASSTYLIALPHDPATTTTSYSAYYINKNATSSRVTVCAPYAENNVTISVTR